MRDSAHDDNDGSHHVRPGQPRKFNPAPPKFPRSAKIIFIFVEQLYAYSSQTNVDYSLGAVYVYFPLSIIVYSSRTNDDQM